MERAILGIVLIVVLVGVIGLFSQYDFTSPQDALVTAGPTGNVVATTPGSSAVPDCSACSGYSPVCARINHLYMTFSNTCEAQCAGAVVAFEYPCSHVRRN